MPTQDLLESNPTTDGTGPQHREHFRYAFRGRALAVIFPDTPDGLAEEWEVVTTDVSRGGVSIMHRKTLSIGQQVMLVLEGAHRFVEVCWCCEVWSGLFAAGCRFVDEPNDQARDHFLASDERQ
jgi:hypothetical protein